MSAAVDAETVRLRQRVRDLAAENRQLKARVEQLDLALDYAVQVKRDVPLPGPGLAAWFDDKYGIDGLRSRDKNSYERLRRWRRGEETPTREGAEKVAIALGGTAADLPERHELPPVAEEVST